jgi:glycosyltransferase involved in cell wall biosynthesis
MPPKVDGDMSFSRTANNDEDDDLENQYVGARIGGIANCVSEMARNLPEYEHHVLLSQGLTRFTYGKWMGRKAVENRDGLQIHYFPNTGDIGSLEDVDYTFKGILEGKYDDFCFDVVVTHVVQPNMDLSNVSKKVVRWVNATHGSPTNKTLPEEYMRLIDENWRFSPYQSGVGSLVVPFPIDTEIFKSYTNEPQQDFVWFGRIAPEKRILPFAERFSREMKDYNLTIIGGADHPHMMGDIDALGSNIDYIGRKFDENLAKIVSNHKYFVLMSEYETYCVALLEAIACGCSCYAIYHPCLEWARGRVHFVEDMDELFEAIKNPVLCRENNMEWIKQYYSWDGLREDYQHLLTR